METTKLSEMIIDLSPTPGPQEMEMRDLLTKIHGKSCTFTQDNVPIEEDPHQIFNEMLIENTKPNNELKTTTREQSTQTKILLVDQSTQAGTTITEDNSGNMRIDTDGDNIENDININNISCSFTVNKFLDIKEILQTVNYENDNSYEILEKAKGKIVIINTISYLRLRIETPKATAKISPTGKVQILGIKNIIDSKKASVKTIQILEMCTREDPPMEMEDWKIFNVKATYKTKFRINLRSLQTILKNRKQDSQYPICKRGNKIKHKIMEPTATFMIYTTGSINIFVQNIEDAALAMRRLYPTLQQCKDNQTPYHTHTLAHKRKSYKDSYRRIPCARCSKTFNQDRTYKTHLKKHHYIKDVQQFLVENHRNLQEWSKESENFSQRTKSEMNRKICEKQKADRLDKRSYNEMTAEKIEEEDLDHHLRVRSSFRFDKQ